MADEITRVDYYMGTIPHKVGEGARILNAFKQAGLSLTGFLGYPKTGKLAEMVVIVGEKAPSPVKVAKQAGLALGKKQRAFFINGEDRVGALADPICKLAEAGINVISTHAVCAGAGRFGAVLTVQPADFKKAAKALGI